MSKIIKYILLLFFVVILDDASACMCPGKPLLKEYLNSKYVVYAKAINIKEIKKKHLIGDNHEFYLTNYLTELEVIKSYKWFTPNKIKVLGEGSCSVALSTAKEYLLFINEKEGENYASICGNSGPLFVNKHSETHIKIKLAYYTILSLLVIFIISILIYIGKYSFKRS